MRKNGLTRRDFIQKTLAAGVVLTGLSPFQSCSGYNAKGLPTVPFGRTGVRIPRISIGLGSRFCSVGDEDKGLEILTHALDNGIYYWDTANSYIDRGTDVISEERIGKILKNRRDEIFLSTKIGSRDSDEAMRQVEASLKRLQTDHLDNLMIHSVGSVEDVDNITKSGGVYDLISRLKEDRVTRFIGFSSHSNADAMKLMIERGDFDDVLFAMDQYNDYSQNRQETAIPAAIEKGMGVLLMKVVRPRETVAGIDASQLIRFALSLEGPSGLVLGMDSVEVVKANLDMMHNFLPMDAYEMDAVASQLSPFFNKKNQEWALPGYRDGHWG